ncbi:MAG: division/cell wall cluster transcriptional repressor MraZ [Alphaproteobacteria bacterium]|nr:division/cell wall cluster transcriptional repressor MraZ [Alphaproteobacteria bacterium]MBV9420295.1 division/cell wall cluster transcriptional repressor MraZ [Alphaproteobacteria bacterium]
MSVLPFMSTVMGSLDSKGRVLIPAPFRQVLTAQNTPGVFVYPSFFEAAIEGFGQLALDGLQARLATLDPFLSPAHDDMAAAIIARTQTLPLDDGGRIRLPDALIAHANLKDRVAIVGMSAKFQIWNADTYAAREAESIARMKVQREKLIEGGA